MKLVTPNWVFTAPLTERSRTNFVVLHHTDGDPGQDIQDIWDEHIANGWIGIGYHYVISGDGTVYQGRPIGSIGAQTLGYNYESIGIALMGNFMNYAPTQEQIIALKQLLSEIIFISYPGIPLKGHRDYNATDCPGDYFYNKIWQIQASF